MVISSAPLRLLRTSQETLYFEDLDDHVLALDARSLKLRWSVAGVRTGFDSWSRAGDANMVLAGDLVTIEERTIVRRSARTGEPIAQAPFAGQLVDGHAVGERALISRGGEPGDIAVLDLACGPTFGHVVWSLADGNDGPIAHVRAYDARDDYSPGDVIRHPGFGVGTVARVFERQLIAAFAMGGRRLPCANRGEQVREAPPARGRASEALPRRYASAIPLGPWALVGYHDLRDGDDYKVKGVEGLELRDLLTGREHIASAPIEIECAATHKDDTRREAVDHDLWGVDARGAVMRSRGGASLYEMDARTGQLAWTTTEEDRYPSDVVLSPTHAFVVWQVRHDLSETRIDAIERASGETAWRTPFAIDDDVQRNARVAIARDTLYHAWADSELHVIGCSLRDGTVQSRLDGIGRTLGYTDLRPVQLIPRDDGMLVIVDDGAVTIAVRID